MNFNMKRPCANCPWRKEGAIQLAEGRRDGIVKDLLKDDLKTFWCHKTLEDRGNESACMGALAYLDQLDHVPVTARLAYMVGDLKREDVERSKALIVSPDDCQAKR
ncbi:hypothetical protein D9M69_538670 [compost metagenome]